MEERVVSTRTPEELLALIEIGDIVTLLSEENMKGFNDLMKYELIAIKDEKIFLTDLGRAAKLYGVKETLERKMVQKTEAVVSPKIPFKIRRHYLYLSLLFLFLAFLLLIFQISSQ